MENIILFGASQLGKIAYSCLKDRYNVIKFVDNDRNKWGKKLCEVEIVSPDYLYSLKENSFVVISSQYDVAIAQQLMQMGIMQFGVFKGDLNRVDFFDYCNLSYLKKKSNKISLITKNYSGSNSYALYKLIPAEYASEYEIVLLNEKIKKENYYLDVIESKLVIHNDYHSTYFNENQINVQLWHGFPLKTLSYMSKLPEHIKKITNMEWQKLDVIASYSCTYNTVLNACFGIDGNKYKITGMPRNDFLFVSKGRENLSRLLKINLDYKKIIMYMPTFRESVYGLLTGDSNKYSILDMPGFDLKLFDKYLETLGLIVILKYHPINAQSVLERIKSNRLQNIYVLDETKLQEENMDIYEVLNAVDILVTDYSSVYFDFLLLDRPIIFTPLDIEEYRRNVGFLLEPYDFWTPGPKCFTYDDLISSIEKCLNDDGYYKKERETICNIVHHYKDANSSQRVWQLVDELMRSR